MAYNDLPADLVRRVKVQTVEAYLASQGWDVSHRGNLSVVYRPSGRTRGFGVAIPNTEELGDFELRMAEVLAEIAVLEERPSTDLLFELLRPDSDTLRFRRDELGTEDGSISFDEGLSLLGGTRKAILSSACAILRPYQQFHPRMTDPQAGELVGRCRLGQTERGSFVATVVLPLKTDQETSNAPFGEQSLPEIAANSLSRKVSAYLLQSIERISTAVERKESESLLKLAVGTPIITANLCEALREMMPQSATGRLEVSAGWAVLAPQDNSVPRSVSIPGEYAPVLEEVARRLRPSAEPQASTFVGKVDTLSGEPNADGKMHGDTTLKLQADDELVSAKVFLGPEEYQIAVAAHGADRYVTITGVLHRAKRMHSLESYSAFSLLNLSGGLFSDARS
jgi:hypothetical protein